MYLVKISITDYKTEIALLNLLINFISAKSVSHILSITDKLLFCLFCFFNFLITGMCNSSDNSLCDKFLFLLPLPAKLFRVAKVSDHTRVAEFFLSKHLKAVEASLHWYPSYFRLLAI